jgi:general secretion pathway protein I
MAEAGFTLLEVLVALVIASLALGALFLAAGTGLRTAALSGHYAQAVSRAKSHLAAVGVGTPLMAINQTGEDGGGFRWRLSIRPEATATLDNSSGALGVITVPRIALYAVSVTITWGMDGGPRSFELDTQRIGAAPAVSP